MYSDEYSHSSAVRCAKLSTQLVTYQHADICTIERSIRSAHMDTNCDPIVGSVMGTDEYSYSGAIWCSHFCSFKCSILRSIGCADESP